MRKKKEQELLELEKQKKEHIAPSGWEIIKAEVKNDKLALFSFWLLVVLFAFIIIASFILDEQAIMRVNIFEKYARPSRDGFLLGADAGGRSVLGQLIIGARNSILIGFFVTIITSALGILVGMTLGYYGGKVDHIGMRIIDFITILPITMIIIVFMRIKSKPNIFSFIFIMSIFYWTGIARLVRSKTLSESRRDYVSASKTMGASDFKILFKEILPNISSIIIVDTTLGFAGNIGIETGLSFLGFGLPSNTPSLGTLISFARRPEVIADKLYVWLPASLLILVLMLSINYVGTALRRAADAKQRLV